MHEPMENVCHTNHYDIYDKSLLLSKTLVGNNSGSVPHPDRLGKVWELSE